MLGTVLNPARPAAPFELQDQFGRRVRLDDHQGNVVVLTFLYTYCPDICPVVTSHLRDARRLLGEDAGKVAFVAVSVDPERDSVERAHQFSEDWGMLHDWSFLVGEEEELSPVWRSYYLDPGVVQLSGDHEESASEDGDHSSGVDALQYEIASRFNVVHSAPVYLIDRAGLLRVVFTLPMDPEALAHDIRLLLD